MIKIDRNRIICNIIVKIYPFCFRLAKDFWKKNRQFNFIIFFWFDIWPLTLILEKRDHFSFVRTKFSDAPHYPLSNDINLAVCSLGTLNPSEQFSICSTISFLLIYKTRPNDFDLQLGCCISDAFSIFLLVSKDFKIIFLSILLTTSVLLRIIT